MKNVKCRFCQKVTSQLIHGTNFFCNRKCYMDWKRKNPNKKPYLPRIFFSGYWYLYKPNHPNAIKGGRYIAEHRFILEQKIGRYLNRGEIAHHKNHNKKDNRPENIELLTISEHNRNHALKRRRKKDGKF